MTLMHSENYEGILILKVFPRIWLKDGMGGYIIHYNSKYKWFLSL